MGGEANPVVMRCYREPSEAESCEQAVRLLLQFTEKEGRSASGPDNAKVRSDDDSRATSILPS